MFWYWQLGKLGDFQTWLNDAFLLVHFDLVRDRMNGAHDAKSKIWATASISIPKGQ